MDQAHIRNFSIIAHIDHGKSTLADRILEMTKTVDPREMRAQLLDSMDLERERGITIKAQAVRVLYTARDGETYQLHLIDTPGPRRLHLRGLALAGRVRGRAARRRRLPGRRGADARQHVPGDRLRARADPVPEQDRPARRRARAGRAPRSRSCSASRPIEISAISGKTGEGVVDVLEELVAKVPAPAGDPDAPPRALIFDSEFDQYRGVDRVHPRRRRRVPQGRGDPRDGRRNRGRHRRHRLLHAGDDGRERAARGRGRLPDHRHQGRHAPARRRHADDARHGGATEPLPGYRDVKPMVFCGPLPDRLRRLSRPARRAGEADAQRRGARPGSRRPRTRSGSAFAAASSGCCTWTSCASDWSASTTSTC